MARKKPRELTAGEKLFDRIVELQGGQACVNERPVDLTLVWGEPGTPAEKLRAGRTRVNAHELAGRRIVLREVVFDNNATHDPTTITHLEIDEWDLERDHFGTEERIKDSPGPFYAPDRTEKGLTSEQRLELIGRISEALGQLTQAQ